MKLIDANVFIYAAGRPHPLQEPSRTVLARVANGEHDANTDVEVLQELLNYYHRNGSLEYGRGVFRNAVGIFPQPIAIDAGIMESAEVILAKHANDISARDAIHAAVVQKRSLEGIISADRGFDAIPGVTRFDPRDF